MKLCVRCACTPEFCVNTCKWLTGWALCKAVNTATAAAATAAGVRLYGDTVIYVPHTFCTLYTDYRTHSRTKMSNISENAKREVIIIDIQFEFVHTVRRTTQ